MTSFGILFSLRSIAAVIDFEITAFIRTVGQTERWTWLDRLG